MKIANHGHVLGGALLVSGTSIGAGMLALPVISSLAGLLPSLLIYLISWFVMCYTGLLFLEISLGMPEGSNILSMSEKYLGPKGKAFCWVIYLFLFYSLSIAYISAGGGLIKSIFSLPIGLNGSIFLFLLIFGSFVYVGAKAVDRINIFLMLGLISSYFLFVFLGIKFIDAQNFLYFNFKKSIFAFPIILLSFGYQGIMPTLTYYMKSDYKKVRLSIILGTSLTFLVYVIWELLVLGIIPLEGLKEALIKGQSAIEPLGNYTKIKTVYTIGKFFSFFAIATSFLGVTLGLFDFIADGFKISKKGINKFFIALLTFLPPFAITLINPNLFLIALNYAGGLGGVFLLILLPTMLVWSKRYIKKEKDVSSQLIGGKVTLSLIIVFSIFIISISLISQIFNQFS